MFDRLDRRPILHALRTHVALDNDVSDALTALHARKVAGLGELLTEARALADELDPSQGGAGSGLDLETWLRTMLHGPHNGVWFDTRVESGRQGWADMPPLASAVVIARLRHRVTEMAAVWHDPTGATADRVAAALGRLFDLEMAIIIVEVDLAPVLVASRDETDAIRSAQREAIFAIGNALAVIETSAYLIGRYSDRDSPSRADIDRHLDRIAKQVVRTKREVGQLLKAAVGGRPLVH
jgi:hypothetical protein